MVTSSDNIKAIVFKNGSLIKYTPFEPDGIPKPKDITEMLTFYGIDGDKEVPCPACPMSSQLKYMIAHLNDGFSHTYSSTYKADNDEIKCTNVKSYLNHSWSFKQIGKWLESLGY